MPLSQLPILKTTYFNSSAAAAAVATATESRHCVRWASLSKSPTLFQPMSRPHKSNKSIKCHLPTLRSYVTHQDEQRRGNDNHLKRYWYSCRCEHPQQTSNTLHQKVQHAPHRHHGRHQMGRACTRGYAALGLGISRRPRPGANWGIYSIVRPFARRQTSRCTLLCDQSRMVAVVVL